MQGVFSNENDIYIFLNIALHESPLQAMVVPELSILTVIP